MSRAIVALMLLALSGCGTVVYNKEGKCDHWVNALGVKKPCDELRTPREGRSL